MVHLPELIVDLALILTVAAFTSLLFKKLKQPLVLGYIIAGVLVGPNFNLFPTVVDIGNIRTWGDIGVVFLLFSLGLEFSFKKMIKLGSVVILTALTGVLMTLMSGYALGQLLGLDSMNSLFLGGMLSISSTTIIIRAYDELNLKTQSFASLVTGVLVIEDLVAVVLMVVLSSVAVSRSFEGTEMIASMLKLVFFLVLWFVSGIFFLPTLLRKIKKLLSNESLLILSLSLCFIMVWLATEVGYSSALGAFIMGSVLAETTKAEKIEHLMMPLKDLFGAIFFVSVGMLIEAEVIVRYIGPIILSTLILLIIKPLFVTIGALLSGQNLKTSVQAGMSLSQIGEFSFIIAGLGQSLKVTDHSLYPIAVAVSVITTFTTPFMMKLSSPMHAFLLRKLPEKWLSGLERYSNNTESATHLTDFKRLYRFYMSRVVIYSVIIITIILTSRNLLYPALVNMKYSKPVVLVITMAIMSPFIWALAFRRTQRQLYANVWMHESNRAPLVVLMLSRILLAVFFIGFLLDQFYSFREALIGVFPVLVILIVFAGKIRGFYGKIEKRFIANMSERDKIEDTNAILSSWDTHIGVITVPENSVFVGKTLQDLAFREKFGVNIAKIERGTRVVFVPERNEQLFPGDKLSVIGSDADLKNFETSLNAPVNLILNEESDKKITLSYLILEEGSEFIGKTIETSGIRKLSRGMVIAIEREEGRLMNPSSQEMLKEKDKVWLVGDSRRVKVMTVH